MLRWDIVTAAAKKRNLHRDARNNFVASIVNTSSVFQFYMIVIV
jgi:hypothetical protein